MVQRIDGIRSMVIGAGILAASITVAGNLNAMPFFSSGSGLVINNNGYILTNHHTVTYPYRLPGGHLTIEFNCTDLWIEAGHERIDARIVIKDEANDLAVVKVPPEKLFKTFPHLRIARSPLEQQVAQVRRWQNINEIAPATPAIGADSPGTSSPSAKLLKYLKFSKVRQTPGQKVNLLGYPLAHLAANPLKITTGVVSANSGFDDNSNRFQLDAASYGGNSGGPVVNQSGDVVGVLVSGIRTTENFSFAIKSSVAQEFLRSNNIEFHTSSESRSFTAKEIYRRSIGAVVRTRCYGRQRH